MPSTKPCPDCGVLPGKKHRGCCDVERCGVCGGQAISCGCRDKCSGVRCTRTLWTGDWPGVAECRERGWYSQDQHIPNSRWGSFCPCPPDAPGASEDLNRWAWFQVTGKDDMYDGCDRVPLDAAAYAASAAAFRAYWLSKP
jgi:hypothetical protein